MARSLIDYVQTIMDDMGSDSVNSFADSLESQRVASILRRTYFDMAAELDLPTREELFVLTALGDTSRPTHMRIPDNIRKVNWIQYDMKVDGADTQIRYRDVDYMEPDVFFRMVSGRNSNDATVDVVEDPTNIRLLIENNGNPRFWTSFDGEFIVFDRYDNNVSNTIEVSKVACHGLVEGTWVHQDTAIPDIPEHMEATFLAIAEQRCFEWVKQQGNAVAADNARRYRIAGRHDKDRLQPSLTRYGNFGRRSPKLSNRTRLGDNVT